VAYALSDEIEIIDLEMDGLEGRMVAIDHRKSHTPFQMRWKLSTLDDLEGQYCKMNCRGCSTSFLATDRLFVLFAPFQLKQNALNFSCFYGNSARNESRRTDLSTRNSFLPNCYILCTKLWYVDCSYSNFLEKFHSITIDALTQKTIPSVIAQKKLHSNIFENMTNSTLPTHAKCYTLW